MSLFVSNRNHWGLKRRHLLKLFCSYQNITVSMLQKNVITEKSDLIFCNYILPISCSFHFNFKKGNVCEPNMAGLSICGQNVGLNCTEMLGALVLYKELIDFF